MSRERHSEAVPLTLIVIFVIYCLIDAIVRGGAGTNRNTVRTPTQPDASLSSQPDGRIR